MPTRKGDKIMSDLHRLMATQDFKSVAELEAFMKGLMNEPIPQFEQEALTDHEKAQDLVFEAYELPHAKALENTMKALTLNPDCIEAFEFLGQLEEVMPIAMAYFEKGIEIGRRLYGAEYRKSHPGEFWIHHETRPFMRCLAFDAMYLYQLGRKQESIAMYEEIIRLNPSDNQGIRDIMMLYMIELNEDEKFVKYSNKFKHDCMVFSRYNKVLFEFKTNGASASASLLLDDAIVYNPHVPALLLSKNATKESAPQYSPGDKNEALYYAEFAYTVWRTVPNALEWLKGAKRKK
jgi:tetratricopeptide (TPR) repeat protein